MALQGLDDLAQPLDLGVGMVLGEQRRRMLGPLLGEQRLQRLDVVRGPFVHDRSDHIWRPLRRPREPPDSLRRSLMPSPPAPAFDASAAPAASPAPPAAPPAAPGSAASPHPAPSAS